MVKIGGLQQSSGSGDGDVEHKGLGISRQERAGRWNRLAV